MNDPNDIGRRRVGPAAFSINPLAGAAFSLAAIIATFLLANSPLDLVEKAVGFGGIVAMILVVFGRSYFLQTKGGSNEAIESTVDIERVLAALDEAGQYFTGSLRSADTFRLLTSRIGELVPFRATALFLLDSSRTELCVAHAEGAGAAALQGKRIAFDEGLAGQCITRKSVSVDGYLELDEEQEFRSAVAIPLRNGSEVFGVLQMFFDESYDIDGVDQTIFEAIGNRIAPLILASIAFDRSQANALMDITTDLPNERAFYLVLENQVAEAARKREERPLTILAIDIKNFDEINKRFGHAAGDRVLNFVAQIIKDNLRQMDFLSRSIGDEFLVILPTATKEISHDIIARVHTGFFGRKFKINEEQSLEVELNIGWASFGGDGDTPGGLLSLAQLRKEQSKSVTPGNVLWFPHETAH